MEVHEKEEKQERIRDSGYPSQNTPSLQRALQRDWAHYSELGFLERLAIARPSSHQRAWVLPMAFFEHFFYLINDSMYVGDLRLLGRILGNFNKYLMTEIEEETNLYFELSGKCLEIRQGLAVPSEAPNT